MEKQTLGKMIASLRKEKGMTQLQLAELMGVTDKAVSKWERDISAPDLYSLPKLAEAFGVTVDALMQGSTQTDAAPETPPIRAIIDTALKGVGAAMGIAVTVLSLLGVLDGNTAFSLLGIGLACVSISLL